MGWVAALCLGLSLVAAPAMATPVQFLEFGTAPTGFDPNGFPLPVDVVIPPGSDLRPAPAGFFPDGFGLSLGCTYFFNEAPTTPVSGCTAQQQPGSTGYTLVVEMTLSSIPLDVPADQDSLIFFAALPPVPTYAISDVSVIVDPDPIGGFTFSEFTSSSLMLGPTTTALYLGFWLSQGETATYRVDVTGDHSAAGAPLAFGAAGWVVPEPGTALLVGVGLAIMARRRSR